MKQGCSESPGMLMRKRNEAGADNPGIRGERVKGPFEIICFNPLVTQARKPSFLATQPCKGPASHTAADGDLNLGVLTPSTPGSSEHKRVRPGSNAG